MTTPPSKPDKTPPPSSGHYKSTPPASKWPTPKPKVKEVAAAKPAPLHAADGDDDLMSTPSGTETK